MKKAKESVSPPLRKYKNGWNKQEKKIASWKKGENQMNLRDEDRIEERSELSKGDSWLDEQSFITDSDFAEIANVKL